MENMADIIWYDSIDSTNSEARRRLDDITGTTVIAALEQTAGRGQRGNAWKTEAGSNLTFSLILKAGDGLMPEIPVSCQFVISMAVTLGLKDYLAGEGIDVRIKWPNDIYFNDRKICGMLIENSVMDGKLKSSIIGIGLNINQQSFPPEIPNPVSMSQITGKDNDIRHALEEVLSCLVRTLRRIPTEPQALKNEFHNSLYRLDRRHRFIDMKENQEFTGIIRGVSPSAMLQVEMENGEIHEYAFKEISYII